VIPDEEVERVREGADIVAIIGEHVSLRKVGADYRGPCPFHQGTHRNFSVSPRRRMYRCFVCGEGGDVFSFLQKRLGVDWPSAVRLAAEKSGLDLREPRQRREGPDPRETIWEVNATAAEYFRRTLWEDPLGEAARAYLASRDVTRELADRFTLGFAPREIGLMRSHLASLGFDDTRQLDAGVLVRHEETAEPRPRFRARIIFPIFDVSGRPVGFGGRLIGPGEPKYLNSAENPAFSKGKLLYGLSWAKHAIRRDDRVLLVEGYFDVVRLVAAGVEAVVAPLGTALTADQATLLTRYSKNVFLLYDSDSAGLKATFKAGDELLRQGATVRVVTLPAGEDPDTYVQQQGRQALEARLEEAIDVFDRKMQLLERSGWFSDLHRRRQAIDRLLPTIRAAADPVMRDMYIGRVSEASGVDRLVLREEVGEVERARDRRPPESTPPPPAAPTERRNTNNVQPARRAVRAAGRAAAWTSAERYLLWSMLASPALIERVAQRVGPADFREPNYREIFGVLINHGVDASPNELMAGLTPAAVAVLEVLLSERDALQDIERTVADCLTRLEVRTLKERNAEINRLMIAATGKEKDDLISQKQANTEEIRRLTESAAVQ
jgi:DNA primase